MNCLFLTLLLLGTCGLQGRATTIDDFDGYQSGTYIQAQNKSWSRYGNATSDGIDSIAEGFHQRGASYVANWTTATPTGSVRYTFASSQKLTATPVLSVELAVLPSPVTGTEVTASISNGTTSYRIAQAQPLANLSYSLYSFDFTQTTTCEKGTDSLQTVLENATSVTITFTNANSPGAQTIHFDNVSMTASGPASTTASK